MCFWCSVLICFSNVLLLGIGFNGCCVLICFRLMWNSCLVLCSNFVLCRLKVSRLDLYFLISFFSGVVIFVIGRMLVMCVLFLRVCRVCCKVLVIGCGSLWV